MKATISIFQFRDDMVGDGSFSYEGARALYEYLEEMEDSDGEEMMYCKADICMQYTEYENIEAIAEQYDHVKTLNDLRDYTQVIEVPNSDKIIIEQF